MEYIIQSFQTLITPTCIGLMLFGTAMGVIFGAIPGLNATIGMTLMLPFTFKMEPEMGIAVLMGIYIGGVSGGFISATLVGIPGTNASIATCYDAYPMSQRGDTVRALGTGAVASFIGTFISAFFAMFLVRYLSKVAVMLGPWEYFSLCFCAIGLIIALSEENIFKGMASALIGMFVATIGASPIDASFRFTFGSINLISGVDLIAMMLGIFAIKLIAVNFARGTQKMPEIKKVRMKGFGITKEDLKGNWFNILRSFFLGMWIGFLPGLGGGISNMVAYGQAKRASKHPEEFGKGCVDGVWASEVSNNSTIGGALIPMLSLGVPGDNLSALLMSGLMVHGIACGPLLIYDRPALVYTVFLGAIFASIYTLLMQYYGMRVFPNLLRTPYHYLYSSIIFICFMGAFSSNYTLFNCGLVLVFGIISVLLTYGGFPIAPLILGFIVSPLLEKNLRMGLTYTDKGFLPFITRPISGAFLLVAVVSLALALRDRRKAQRKARETKDAEEMGDQ